MKYEVQIFTQNSAAQRQTIFVHNDFSSYPMNYVNAPHKIKEFERVDGRFELLDFSEATPPSVRTPFPPKPANPPSSG